MVKRRVEPTLEVADELARPVAVVGAGNWLISHDRIGPRVLELLQERSLGPEVGLIEIASTGFGLLDCIRGQDLMVVVDACVLGGAPGQISVLEPDLEAPASAHPTSVHQFGPLESLAVAKMLFPDTLPQRISLVLVETQGIDERTQEAACQEVAATIERRIAEWRAQRTSRHERQNSDTPQTSYSPH